MEDLNYTIALIFAAILKIFFFCFCCCSIIRKKQRNQQLLTTEREHQDQLQNPIQRYESIQQQLQQQVLLQHLRQIQHRQQRQQPNSQQQQQQILLQHLRQIQHGQQRVRGNEEHGRQQQPRTQQQQQTQQQPRTQQQQGPLELNIPTLRNGLASLSIQIEETDFPPSYSRSVSLNEDLPINLNEKDCPPSYYDALRIQNFASDKLPNCDENQNTQMANARWLHAKKLITRRLIAGQFIEIMQQKEQKSRHE